MMGWGLDPDGKSAYLLEGAWEEKRKSFIPFSSFLISVGWLH
jgi:hypothetical protein